MMGCAPLRGMLTLMAGSPDMTRYAKPYKSPLSTLRMQQGISAALEPQKNYCTKVHSMCDKSQESCKQGVSARRTCSPGKTEKLMRSSRSYMISLPFLFWPLTPLRKKIMAPLGPRSDLCVVVVTTSE